MWTISKADGSSANTKRSDQPFLKYLTGSEKLKLTHFSEPVKYLRNS